MADNHWSRSEVDAIVKDYLAILEAQLECEVVNKSARQRQLALRLDGRTNGSIQYKYRNISAILVEVGFPRVAGYKPLFNYQGLLAEVVLNHLQSAQSLERLVARDAEQVSNLVVPTIDEILNAIVSPPKREPNRSVREPAQGLFGVHVSTHGVNYAEVEARNRSLGLAGELFAVRFEQARLIHEGQERLAAQVDHVSVSRGDGLGYDVLSFDADGRERLIEVKTTKRGPETPFFVSANEVVVSSNRNEQYQLYRVFDFRQQAKMFALRGPISQTCELDAVSYRARVA